MWPPYKKQQPPAALRDLQYMRDSKPMTSSNMYDRKPMNSNMSNRKPSSYDKSSYDKSSYNKSSYEKKDTAYDRPMPGKEKVEPKRPSFNLGEPERQPSRSFSDFNRQPANKPFEYEEKPDPIREREEKAAYNNNNSRDKSTPVDEEKPMWGWQEESRKPPAQKDEPASRQPPKNNRGGDDEPYAEPGTPSRHQIADLQQQFLEQMAALRGPATNFVNNFNYNNGNTNRGGNPTYGSGGDHQYSRPTAPNTNNSNMNNNRLPTTREEPEKKEPMLDSVSSILFMQNKAQPRFNARPMPKSDAANNDSKSAPTTSSADKNKPPMRFCTRDYRPVCFIPDMKTHSNECMFWLSWDQKVAGKTDAEKEASKKEIAEKEQLKKGMCEEHESFAADYPVQPLPKTINGVVAEGGVMRVGLFFGGRWFSGIDTQTQTPTGFSDLIMNDAFRGAVQKSLALAMVYGNSTRTDVGNSASPDAYTKLLARMRTHVVLMKSVQGKEQCRVEDIADRAAKHLPKLPLFAGGLLRKKKKQRALRRLMVTRALQASFSGHVTTPVAAYQREAWTVLRKPSGEPADARTLQQMVADYADEAMRNRVARPTTGVNLELFVHLQEGKPGAVDDKTGDWVKGDCTGKDLYMRSFGKPQLRDYDDMRKSRLHHFCLENASGDDAAEKELAYEACMEENHKHFDEEYLQHYHKHQQRPRCDKTVVKSQDECDDVGMKCQACVGDVQAELKSAMLGGQKSESDEEKYRKVRDTTVLLGKEPTAADFGTRQDVLTQYNQPNCVLLQFALDARLHKDALERLRAAREGNSPSSALLLDAASFAARRAAADKCWKEFGQQAHRTWCRKPKQPDGVCDAVQTIGEGVEMKPMRRQLQMMGVHGLPAEEMRKREWERQNAANNNNKGKRSNDYHSDEKSLVDDPCRRKSLMKQFGPMDAPDSETALYPACRKLFSECTTCKKSKLDDVAVNGLVDDRCGAEKTKALIDSASDANGQNKAALEFRRTSCGAVREQLGRVLDSECGACKQFAAREETARKEDEEMRKQRDEEMMAMRGKDANEHHGPGKDVMMENGEVYEREKEDYRDYEKKMYGGYEKDHEQHYPRFEEVGADVRDAGYHVFQSDSGEFMKLPIRKGGRLPSFDPDPKLIALLFDQGDDEYRSVRTELENMSNSEYLAFLREDLSERVGMVLSLWGRNKHPEILHPHKSHPGGNNKDDSRRAPPPAKFRDEHDPFHNGKEKQHRDDWEKHQHEQSVGFGTMDFLNLNRTLNETLSTAIMHHLHKSHPNLADDPRAAAKQKNERMLARHRGGRRLAEAEKLSSQSTKIDFINLPYANLISLEQANSYIKRLPFDPRKKDQERKKEENKLCLSSNFGQLGRAGVGGMALEYVCHVPSGRVLERCAAMMKYRNRSKEISESTLACSKDQNGMGDDLSRMNGDDSNKQKPQRQDPCRGGELDPVCDTRTGRTYRHKACAESFFKIREGLTAVDELQSALSSERLLPGQCVATKMPLFSAFDDFRLTKGDKISSTVINEVATNLPLDFVANVDVDSELKLARGFEEGFTSAFGLTKIDPKLRASVLEISVANGNGRRRLSLREFAELPPAERNLAVPDGAVTTTIQLGVMIPEREQKRDMFGNLYTTGGTGLAISGSAVRRQLDLAKLTAADFQNLHATFKQTLTDNGFPQDGLQALDSFASGVGMVLEQSAAFQNGPAQISTDDMNLYMAEKAEQLAALGTIVSATPGFQTYWTEVDRLKAELDRLRAQADAASVEPEPAFLETTAGIVTLAFSGIIACALLAFASLQAHRYYVRLLKGGNYGASVIQMGKPLTRTERDAVRNVNDNYASKVEALQINPAALQQQGHSPATATSPGTVALTSVDGGAAAKKKKKKKRAALEDSGASRGTTIVHVEENVQRYELYTQPDDVPPKKKKPQKAKNDGVSTTTTRTTATSSYEERYAARQHQEQHGFRRDYEVDSAMNSLRAERAAAAERYGKKNKRRKQQQMADDGNMVVVRQPNLSGTQTSSSSSLNISSRNLRGDRPPAQIIVAGRPVSNQEQARGSAVWGAPHGTE